MIASDYLVLSTDFIRSEIFQEKILPMSSPIRVQSNMIKNSYSFNQPQFIQLISKSLIKFK